MFVRLEPLLLCQAFSWAFFVGGVSFWHQQACSGSEAGIDTSGRILQTAQQSRSFLSDGSSAPWSEAVLHAVQSGIEDAKAPGEDDAVSVIFDETLLGSIRLVVSKNLKAAKKASQSATRGDASQADPSAATGGSSAGSEKGLDEMCSGGRPPVNLKASPHVTVPVLDALDGKVKGPGFYDIDPVMPNRWGVPMANVTVEVSPGRILTVDEIVYGYDLVFEAMHLFSYVSWGRVPMQQDPTDAMAIADLIGRLQPDCFVELGTNTGGGAVFYAEVMKQYQPNPLVVTIDVHSPLKNWDRFAAKACPHCVPVTCHPIWNEPGLIEFVQGYTHDPIVIAKVRSLLAERKCKRTIVMHDSDHRQETILKDLAIYHEFVQVGSYLVVQDTKLSRMRGVRYGTLEAVHKFLETPAGKGHFQVDKTFEYLLFSHHHDGFMQRVA
eukprot:TRINITY_DN51195_c0_g1_i1.p1 TRINITY_DN51195_c0_g1~~TRINITY_DN51195_c0_g1_i1.p1  ORF type:complete len:438 (+),score=95.49 TRINITY_DN51195_c0_g1_i1:73-1386(+)